MQKINLKALIENSGRPRKEFSDLLFPDNSRPDLALSRMLELNTELSESQIFKLAQFLGANIEDLFDSSRWASKKQGSCLVFTNPEYPDYEVTLDTANRTSIIRHKGAKVETLAHSAMLPLSDYTRQLNVVLKQIKP